MEFETLLHQINGYGFYQKRMRLMVSITIHAVYCQIAVFMMFASAAPKWACQSEEVNVTFSSDSPNCFLNDSCSQIFEENIVTMATEFGLYCQWFWVGDVLTSIQMVGVLLGALLCGQLSELYGRKWIYFSALLLASGSGLIGAFSPSWPFFAVTIFFVGVGVGGYHMLTFLTIQEVLCPSKRHEVEALNGWPLGYGIFGFLTWYVRNWRHVSIIIHSAGLVCLFFFIWIYESPRWLVQHGHWEKALHVLQGIAKVNKRPQPTMIQIKDLKTVATRQDKKYNYSYLFRTKKYTMYTLVLAYSWFAVSFVTYALIFNSKYLPTDLYLTTEIMAVLGLAGNVAVFLFGKWFGRKTLHRISLLGMAVMLVLVVALQIWGDFMGEAQKYVITVFALVGKEFNVGSWLVCYLYSAELFPTVLRNLSNGLSSMAARIGAILGPLLLLTVHTMPALLYVVFASVCLVNVILAQLFLPETKDKPLPEGLPDKNKNKRDVRIIDEQNCEENLI